MLLLSMNRVNHMVAFNCLILLILVSCSAMSDETVNLMTKDKLGQFEDDDWKGYACDFQSWTMCVNSTKSCDHLHKSCKNCIATHGKSKSITCLQDNNQLVFHFPPGGVFPVAERFIVPSNTVISGAKNPNNDIDKSQQQVDISGQTWFVVPASNALCSDNPSCPSVGACSGDPLLHRAGFLMSTNTTLKDINFQGGKATMHITLQLMCITSFVCS